MEPAKSPHQESADNQVPVVRRPFKLSNPESPKSSPEKPALPFDAMLGNFWPEEESIDEFIATVRAWRRESGS